MSEPSQIPPKPPGTTPDAVFNEICSGDLFILTTPDNESKVVILIVIGTYAEGVYVSPRKESDPDFFEFPLLFLDIPTMASGRLGGFASKQLFIPSYTDLVSRCYSSIEACNNDLRKFHIASIAESN